MYKYVLSFFLTVGLSVSSLGATKAVMVDAATNEIVVPTVTDLFAEDSDNIAAIRDALGMDDLASLLTFDSVRYPGVTTVPGAILELAETNLTGPNPTDGTGKVHWSQIYGVSLAGLGDGVPMYFNGSEVVDTWGLNFIDSDSITVTKTTVTNAPYAITFDLATGYKALLDSFSLATSGATVVADGINTPFVGSVEGTDYIVLTPLIKGKAPTANTPVVILNGPTERTNYGFGIADGYEVKGRVRPNSMHITGNINAPESQYPVASISYNLNDGIRLYNNVLITGQAPRETGATATITRAPSLSIGPNSRINFLKYVDAATLDPTSIQQEDLFNVGWSINQYETGGNTLLSIERYHPTRSYAPAMKISTAEGGGQVQFTNTPTAEGYKMWHDGNDGAYSGLDADTVRGIRPEDLFVLGEDLGEGMEAFRQEVTGRKVFTRQMFDYHKRKKILNPNGGNADYTNTRNTTVSTYIKIVLPVIGGPEPLSLRMQISAKTNTGEFNFELQGDSQLINLINNLGFVPTPSMVGDSGFPTIRYTLKTFDGSLQRLTVFQSRTRGTPPLPVLLIGPFLMTPNIEMHVNIDNIEIFSSGFFEEWAFSEDYEVSFYEDISDVIQTSGNFYGAGLDPSRVDPVHVTPLIDLDTARKFFVANPILNEKTSSFTAEPNHIYAVSSSSAITVTLPRITNLSFLEKGQEIIIQNLGTGVVTLNRSGTDTLLNTLTSYSLGRYDSVVLRPNFRYGPTSISTWLIY